jgi:hypothetical protein
MSRRRQSVFLKLEQRIASSECGGVIHKWRYGRGLIEARAGRKQLPKGFIADRLAEAEHNGLKLSEREIQRRVRCAEVYASEAQVRQILADLGTWTALAEAGFPAVTVDESTDPEAVEISTEPPDAWEQPALIPGFGDTIKVGGRTVPLGEATVGDAKAYRETYRQIHENFGKTLALIEAAVEAMEDGSGGDDDANAVEAWQRGTDDEDAAEPAGGQR